ncbi:MAG: putative ligase, partial [Friedmanniella sp.]|nr:putative ligase [Friedmanniella sp.]
ITRITRPDGWCVMNADDPRTFAMRHGTTAQVWVFTRDPDSPSARAVLDEGGRVSTVLDGWVCVLGAGADPLPVVEVARVPMTLAGLSRVNVENVLAVTSAALALGFTADQVADGLTAFDPGADNPGRMNVWTLPVPGGALTVVIDLAHNEAGLEALLEIMRGLAPPGARLLLGVGSAGDRGDEVFVRLGELAGLHTDVAEIVHKSDYLRGRTTAELDAVIREGASRAGMTVARSHPTELPGLQSLVTQAGPGDVVAVMTHQDRGAVDDWLRSQGATLDTPAELRAKVQRAGA